MLIILKYLEAKCSWYQIFVKNYFESIIVVIVLPSIGVAPITHLRMCVIKIVTFKGGHLM